MNLVQDIELKPGTNVLLRADLNLPMDTRGGFTDFFRMQSSLPTINFLLDSGCKVFIASHLGSPKGKYSSQLSLSKLTKHLESALEQQVKFISDPFKEDQQVHSSKVFLLENLRFWPGEEANSLEFIEDLARGLKLEHFVQDAFGAIHREHASIVSAPKVLPSSAGLLLQKELDSLNPSNLEKPALLVGGAKVESKLPVIESFLATASSVLTGGMVANTLLKAMGKDISSSLYSKEQLGLAKRIIQDKILSPTDYITAQDTDSLTAQEFTQDNLQPGQMILDLGSDTTSRYIQELEKAKSVIWAGTMGYCENKLFAGSSRKILSALIKKKQKDPSFRIVIGGGDTVDFVLDNLDQDSLALVDHVSTGGGASLLALSGQKLPGVEALEQVLNVPAPKGESTQVSSDSTSLASKVPILATNLKSHFDLKSAKAWLQEVLGDEVLLSSQLNFIIIPADIFLEEFSSTVKLKSLANPPEIYSQNISKEKEGSNTGEVAASMLQNIAKGSLIGHSERRLKMEESLNDASKKIERASQEGLKIILCVGGSSKDPQEQKREVYEQLKHALVKFNSKNSDLLTIAYEPVFAIGTGLAPESDFLQDQLAEIRTLCSDEGLDPKILYGGSVDEGNAGQIMKVGFDGVLVGSASLVPQKLRQIAENMLS